MAVPVLPVEGGGVSELDYPRPEPSGSTGLCLVCKDNESLPDHEFCAECLEEVVGFMRHQDPGDENDWDAAA